MYQDKGYFDNYAGQNLKNIKAFFSYLNKDLALGAGSFYKQFYIRKEEISIFPLLPEELNHLISNEDLHRSLPGRLMEVKDVFVFGCTVALRVSDLLALKQTNIREVNGQYYLAVRSIKTNTETLIRLPDYAVAIINKYKNKNGPYLLPFFNKVNLNSYIKDLPYLIP